jgi:excisionase family DNA binding protein
VTAPVSAEERWVDIDEVAAHLRVARKTIYRWIEAKGFPAHRAGRLLRFKLSEVDAWFVKSGGAAGDGSSTSASAEEAGPPAGSREPRRRGRQWRTRGSPFPSASGSRYRGTSTCR